MNAQRFAPCLVCHSQDTWPFFEVTDVPVHVGLQWPTEDAARRCPKSDITLHFCEACGHVFNAAFDPALTEYTEAYDNTLHYSPHFRAYTCEVATHLVERYDLRGKEVIEIGCGKGEFLSQLAELGIRRAVGFDPSYEPDRADGETNERITFVQDFYSECYADYPADLVCSRFVLEHLPDPRGFLSALRRTIGEEQNPAVYFEVPNVSLILRNFSIWDVIYEHCSYFGFSSLARAFLESGFDMRDLYAGYERQQLAIEATPSDTKPGTISDGKKGDINAMRRQVRAFDERSEDLLRTWQQNLDQIAASGQRIMLWGAGAKAVSFANMLSTQNIIDHVVDINPHKQGNYLAGEGQKIVSPEFLTTTPPDVIIVMNPVYEEEICATIDDLGLTVDLITAS
jgi:SAM-dependent methyltransferase